jgi:hypothetical protein
MCAKSPTNINWEHKTTLGGAVHVNSTNKDGAPCNFNYKASYGLCVWPFIRWPVSCTLLQVKENKFSSKLTPRVTQLKHPKSSPYIVFIGGRKRYLLPLNRRLPIFKWIITSYFRRQDNRHMNHHCIFFLGKSFDFSCCEFPPWLGMA